MTALTPRPGIMKIAPYVPGKDSVDGKETIAKLSSNEGALGPSPKAMAAYAKAAAELHRYPDGNAERLRGAIGRHYGLDPARIVCGAGSDELLNLLIRAYCGPGDELLYSQFGFLMYPINALGVGATPVAAPETDYRADVDALLSKVTNKTKVVCLANPNNPTGTYVTKRELDAFLRDLSRETIVFMDEAYYEFVEAPDYPQTRSYINDYPLIVTRSFSKAYGLAGLRVGYGMAQPSLVAAMNAVREPFNVNSLAQAAACAALTDAAFLARTRRLVSEGRRYLTKQLAALGLRSVPSVTNFLLIELGRGAADITQSLLSRGVIVRELSAWQLPGCLRVTIGTMPENRRFIHALKAALGSRL